MFEKTTTDLIKSLRHNKYSTSCIQKALSEIQQEIIKTETRSNAIQKLIVLHLLGQDIQWADFHIIQAMSIKQQKNTGYMAAAVSFNKDTPVLIMATNVIKKDLNSNDVNETLMALHTMAHILTLDLARDLYMDVLGMMNHSSPNVRLRSLVVLYRICTKYPDSFNVCFPRLVDKLEDTDDRVVSTCVTVICELGKLKPESCLPLVPKLFGLFVGSPNNWMLIKMIKLFSSLIPLEPRLGKKLLVPLSNLIKNSHSTSVVYEAVYSIINSNILQNDEDSQKIVNQCVEKLQLFIKQRDPNLKYLGLQCFSKLLVHKPDLVKLNRSSILACLDDGDLTIRTKALGLIKGLVTQESLFEFVQRLILNLADSGGTGDSQFNFTSEERNYRNLVGVTIIEICSSEMYKNVTNFEWYISVLVDLTKCQGLSIGEKLKDQLIDVCVRVGEVREYAIDTVTPLLLQPKLIKDVSAVQFLFGCAWIIGEYAINNVEQLMKMLVNPTVATMPPSIQSVYLLAFLKLFVKHIAQTDKHKEENLSPTKEMFKEKGEGADMDLMLHFFTESGHLEVQDRALAIRELLKETMLAQSNSPWVETLEWTKGLFCDQLLPVAADAQARISIPAGLNLDEWLNPLHESNFESQIYRKNIYNPRIDARDTLAFYLSSSPERGALDDVDVPIERISLDTPLKFEPVGSAKFSSVVTKPEVKKYALNSANAGEELLTEAQLSNFQSIPESKPKKKKKKRRDQPQSATAETSSPFGSLLPSRSNALTLVQTDRYTMEGYIVNQTMEIEEKLDSQIELLLTISFLNKSTSKIDFKIRKVSEGILVKDQRICINVKRETVSNYFTGNYSVTVAIDSVDIEFNFNLPFEANILAVNQRKLGQMTPSKFMDLVQNPVSGGFSAIGTTTLVPPSGIEENQACDVIVSSISAVVVERHPGVVSLYGSTVTGCDFFGLLKERRNKNGKLCMVLDVKTDDQIVLSWIMNALSNLASDWV